LNSYIEYAQKALSEKNKCLEDVKKKIEECQAERKRTQEDFEEAVNKYELELEFEYGKRLEDIRQTINQRAKEYEEIEEAIKEKQNELFWLENEVSEKKLVARDYGKEIENQNYLQMLESGIEAAERQLEELDLIIEKGQKGSLHQHSSNKQNTDKLLAKIDLYERIEEFIDYGHFEMPEYLQKTSEAFQVRIRDVRAEQRECIRTGEALATRNKPQYAKGIINNKIGKLALKAFNIECDFLIRRINPGNYVRTRGRIESLSIEIGKLTGSRGIIFTEKYVSLKLMEAELFFQYKLKDKEEREEQRQIREQIREELKAKRDYEKAISEAEKEKRIYEDLLARAKKEFENGDEDQRLVSQSRIVELEKKLLEAETRAERAKSMAEQTKRGYVYVISNIGSFGDKVYKIGLTRRLEPADRVKELSGASVPFQFDVHAMIYSEDAPALEAELHRELSEFRINVVNHRKEFFKVDLSKIRNAVEKIAGRDYEFITTAMAEEYYESRRLQHLPEFSSDRIVEVDN
jgi:chromosome segregation ATPase